MPKLSKRKFEIIIAVFGLIVGLGFLVLAEFNHSKLFDIPVFKSIWAIIVIVWQFFWAFLKMFWTVFISSWLSIIAILVLVVFFVLGLYYRKNY